jgi:hypothetical protein
MYSSVQSFKAAPKRSRNTAAYFCPYQKIPSPFEIRQLKSVR